MTEQQNNQRVRKANCFGCWKKTKNPALLFEYPTYISSDNVVSRKTYELCSRCWDITINFVMGKESPKYQKGMATLEDEILRTKRREH